MSKPIVKVRDEEGLKIGVFFQPFELNIQIESTEGSSSGD
jgi:hypothetical protein